MQVVHFYHRHHLYKFSKNPDFYYFELAIWAHTLAHSLISVFAPILLLKSGYSIGDIIVYYLIFNSIDIPLNFVVRWLMKKIGARKVMIIGTIFTITFFGLLGIIPPQNWPLLVLLAFFAAAYDTFFWISHIYLFIETSRGSADHGGAVGSLEGLRKFASIIGPAIGALVLIFGGKVFLVLLSVMIFALSIVPLFKMRHVHDVPQEKSTSFWKFFSKAQEKRDYLSIALWGIHNEAEDTLWPLFIFIALGTIGSVAAIPVVVSLTAAAFSFLAGKLTQKYTTRMIIIGSFVIACAWILRIAFQNTFIYYITVFIVGLFSLLVAIPIDSNITSRGIQVGSLSAATNRNIMSMILRVPFYLVLAFLINIFKVSFELAALSLILLLIITLTLKNITKLPES